MTTWEQNVEAYHIVADMLVNLRRIMSRGLEKCAGENWHLDSCPPEIYEALVERKEHEAAVDRFTPDYEQLINFTTFGDLAELLVANDDLAKLLSNLEPGNTTLVERLREMEIVRLKLADARAFADDDIEILSGYHQEFRESLAGRRRQAGGETPVPARAEEAAPVVEEPAPEPAGTDDVTEAQVEPDVDTPEEELQSDEEVFPIDIAEPPEESLPPEGDDSEVAAADFVDEETPHAPDAADFIDEETPLVSTTVEETPPPPRADPEFDSEEVSPPLPMVDHEIGTPEVTSVIAEGLDTPASAAVEAELAMANDDDAGVMRALHREVMWVAEGVYQMDADRPHSVWNALRAGGWYDIKLGELALAPLELFYAVAEEARDRLAAGTEPEDVKEFLAEAHFSKLLLTLRDMFLKQSL
jgi:hypothetical protein